MEISDVKEYAPSLSKDMEELEEIQKEIELKLSPEIITVLPKEFKFIFGTQK